MNSEYLIAPEANKNSSKSLVIKALGLTLAAGVAIIGLNNAFSFKAETSEMPATTMLSMAAENAILSLSGPTAYPVGTWVFMGNYGDW
jgi:hypothetical protein